MLKGKRLISVLVILLALSVLTIGSSIIASPTYNGPFVNPYQNGYEHGQKFQATITSNVGALISQLNNEGRTLVDLHQKLDQQKQLYAKVVPRKVAWMKGVAKATDISYQKILLLNTLPKESCTSFVAQGEATKEDVTIVAKNRDLGAKSLNVVELHPHRIPEEEKYRAAYIKIPQVDETYKFIGVKSAGRWGFGMGINEHQVTIADNDIASMDKLGYLEGLHDNDYIRLALERAKTAREAVKVIGNLTEKYSQSWNGITFLIGDPKEAWVMEVAGYRWVAKKIKDSVTTVANQMEITDDYDLSSGDVVSYAKQQGWITEEDVKNGKINFRKIYGAKEHYPGPKEQKVHKWPLYSSQIRYERGMELLRSELGTITVEDIIRFQRDHYNEVKTREGKVIEMNQVPFYSSKWVGEVSYPRQICHHDIGGKTIASAVMVSKPNQFDELGEMWTQFGQPCQSTYVPFYVGNTSVPPSYGVAGEAPQKFESIRVRAFGSYKLFHSAIRGVFDPFEQLTFKEASSVEKQAKSKLNNGRADLAQKILTNFTYKRVERALELVDVVQARMTDKAVEAQSWGEGKGYQAYGQLPPSLAGKVEKCK